MKKSLYITATGTDVGKTYVTALMAKKLKDSGYDIGYYKPALSGAESVSESDAGYVNAYAKLDQEEGSLLSYLYKNAYSPHLAARIEGNPVDLDKVYADYRAVSDRHDYTLIEGSGGIVCPIRWDDAAHILLEDVINRLSPNVVIIADAGLGTINSTVLTVEYLLKRNITIQGVILNRYDGSVMHLDNARMIRQLTGLPIISRIGSGDSEIDVEASRLAGLFK